MAAKTEAESEGSRLRVKRDAEGWEKKSAAGGAASAAELRLAEAQIEAQVVSAERRLRLVCSDDYRCLDLRAFWLCACADSPAAAKALLVSSRSRRSEESRRCTSTAAKKPSCNNESPTLKRVSASTTLRPLFSVEALLPALRLEVKKKQTSPTDPNAETPDLAALPASFAALAKLLLRASAAVVPPRILNPKPLPWVATQAVVEGAVSLECSFILYLFQSAAPCLVFLSRWPRPAGPWLSSAAAMQGETRRTAEGSLLAVSIFAELREASVRQVPAFSDERRSRRRIRGGLKCAKCGLRSALFLRPGATPTSSCFFLRPFPNCKTAAQRPGFLCRTSQRTLLVGLAVFFAYHEAPLVSFATNKSALLRAAAVRALPQRPSCSTKNGSPCRIAKTRRRSLPAGLRRAAALGVKTEASRPSCRLPFFATAAFCAALTDKTRSCVRCACWLRPGTQRERLSQPPFPRGSSSTRTCSNSTCKRHRKAPPSVDSASASARHFSQKTKPRNAPPRASAAQPQLAVLSSTSVFFRLFQTRRFAVAKTKLSNGSSLSCSALDRTLPLGGEFGLCFFNSKRRCRPAQEKAETAELQRALAETGTRSVFVAS